jgi:ferrochelatase
MDAVVMLNLGAPDGEEGIRPYIRSLLGDRDVVPLPWPARKLLAGFVSRRRSPMVAEHYRAIGGQSPLHNQTRAQAESLRLALGGAVPVRYAFAHSNPGIADVMKGIAKSGARRVVAVPMFPQWSLSTSGSVARKVSDAAAACGLELAVSGSFPDEPWFVDSILGAAAAHFAPGAHLLVSAHGLPLRTVGRGDPYTGEVQRTVTAIAARLPQAVGHSLAYQSRVGRMKWTGPDLNSEVLRLVRSGVSNLVVAPVSFVCENLETVYELDMELRKYAMENGVERFTRLLTPGSDAGFIAGLGGHVRRTAKHAGWEVPDGA